MKKRSKIGVLGLIITFVFSPMSLYADTPVPEPVPASAPVPIKSAEQPPLQPNSSSSVIKNTGEGQADTSLTWMAASESSLSSASSDSQNTDTKNDSASPALTANEEIRKTTTEETHNDQAVFTEASNGPTFQVTAANFDYNAGLNTIRQYEEPSSLGVALAMTSVEDETDILSSLSASYWQPLSGKDEELITAGNRDYLLTSPATFTSSTITLQTAPPEISEEEISFNKTASLSTQIHTSTESDESTQDTNIVPIEELYARDNVIFKPGKELVKGAFEYVATRKDSDNTETITYRFRENGKDKPILTMVQIETKNSNNKTVSNLYTFYDTKGMITSYSLQTYDESEKMKQSVSASFYKAGIDDLGNNLLIETEDGESPNMLRLAIVNYTDGKAEGAPNYEVFKIKDVQSSNGSIDIQDGEKDPKKLDYLYTKYSIDKKIDDEEKYYETLGERNARYIAPSSLALQALEKMEDANLLNLGEHVLDFSIINNGRREELKGFYFVFLDKNGKYGFVEVLYKYTGGSLEDIKVFVYPELDLGTLQPAKEKPYGLSFNTYGAQEDNAPTVSSPRYLYRDMRDTFSKLKDILDELKKGEKEDLELSTEI